MTQSNLLSVASAFIVDLAGPGPDPFTEDDGRFDIQDRFYDVMFSICASTRRLGYMQVFDNSGHSATVCSVSYVGSMDGLSGSG